MIVSFGVAPGACRPGQFVNPPMVYGLDVSSVGRGQSAAVAVGDGSVAAIPLSGGGADAAAVAMSGHLSMTAAVRFWGTQEAVVSGGNDGSLILWDVNAVRFAC